ncbi:MAG: HPr family phosphocarrier protein, partial [Deltaproteobacteria bacterium]
MPQAIAAQKNAGFLEKLHFFSKEFLNYCIYVCESEPARQTFTQRLYAPMVSCSKVLEDFLDFHGAKNSSEWYYYRELVSSVRNLSEACYSQKHIWIRLPFYNLGDTDQFEQAGYETHKFLITSLRAICSRALQEARRLNIKLSVRPFVWEDFPGLPTNARLESDIDDVNLREEKKNIVKITTEFLRVARDFETHGFYEPYSMDMIQTIVPTRLNEQEARRFEMVVHSLQSSFDTYVNRSGLRFRDVTLKSLRGYISVVLHLLELTRRLLHYYERHLYEVGYKNTAERVRDELSQAVNPEQLLDRIVNYGLYYVCHFLVSGQDLAQGLLNENVERGTIVVGVPQKMGFH